MNSLVFLALVAFAKGDVQKTLDFKEGSYELSAQGKDANGICDSQAADLEWVQPGTLVIGSQLSFAHLDTDHAKETDDDCVTTDQNKIEPHHLIQTVTADCKDKTKNYTNTHRLDGTGERLTYTYTHQEQKAKPVTTICQMKYLGPKGSQP